MCSSTCTINDLLPDTICLIFSYLRVRDRGRVAQTCRQWKEIMDRPCLWLDVEAQIHLPVNDIAVYSVLNRRGITKIRVLDIKGNLREITQNLPNISSLNFSGCSTLTDTDIKNTFDAPYPALTSLNFNQCAEITYATVLCVSTFLVNLTHLSLLDCENLTDTAIVTISSNLTELTSLELGQCWVTDIGVKHLAGLATTGSAISGTPQLLRLHLKYCHLITDTGMEFISTGLSCLCELDLSHSPHVTDVGLRHLSGMPSLQTLVLNGCECISALGISYLSAGNCSLKKLGVSNCSQISDEAFEGAIQGPGLVRLSSLFVDGCSITDASLNVIGRTFRNLTHLNMSYCKSITEAGINALSAVVSNMQHINMQHCTQINDPCMAALAKMPTLKTINLKCTKVGNRGMALYDSTASESAVEELDISYTNTRDHGLRRLSEAMPRLQILNISGCRITVRGMKSVTMNLTFLRTLKISRCIEIRDASVKMVAMHLKRLQQIDINGCGRITAAGRLALIRQLPDLEFL
ncbi:F-box/LRR-repeat protein 14-like [Ornithodoros turicata]|uniref:F-box/LRR-repeat protein 14-like n=1 Tax=Ornithodoros turicata TaxID=34597 RepID=UPI0031389131